MQPTGLFSRKMVKKPEELSFQELRCGVPRMKSRVLTISWPVLVCWVLESAIEVDGTHSPKTMKSNITCIDIFPEFVLVWQDVDALNAGLVTA